MSSKPWMYEYLTLALDLYSYKGFSLVLMTFAVPSFLTDGGIEQGAEPQILLK